jgi:hypothetical protein
VHGNNVRVVYGENIAESLRHIGKAAENRCPFGKGAGGGNDGFFEMARQMASMVGTAPLRPMAMGHAAMDPKGRVHGADGLARFGGVDSQGFS